VTQLLFVDVLRFRINVFIALFFILMFDPAALIAVDGGFGEWSDWSICTAGCNGGKQQRHRFYDSPYPKHDGKDCEGDFHEEHDCNTEACPSKILFIIPFLKKA